MLGSREIRNDATRGCKRDRRRDRRAASFALSTASGWTLIELVITLTVLSILTLGVIPIVRTTVKRQKEERLRDALREMRAAIDDFHRDTIGGCAANAAPFAPPGNPAQIYIDPRSRVVISECTIFTVDNPDRYPPELQILVSGVSIIPRANVPAPGQPPAPGGAVVSTQKRVYLRQIPIDPMTGEAEWELRSSYDAADATSWGRENVFDVRSRSRDTALNGERYSDW